MESGLKDGAVKKSRERRQPAQAQELIPGPFRQSLMAWYEAHARDLPWRGTRDPYRIWVSEIMLQQTRVAAVIEHYNEFLQRFPTLFSLSLADERDVLAAWSGLGYYRRARMLHKAARFIVLEREGRFPDTSAELRTLPGIGDYTAAAIASIAFGEPIAVVDGNVERVILRIVGRPEEATAAMRSFIRDQAQRLIPDKLSSNQESVAKAAVRRPRGWDADERIALAAAVHPLEPAGGVEPLRGEVSDAAGNHNQAMMELGAMICLPKAPLCSECPVWDFCNTRGQHVTPARPPQRSMPVAYFLDLRKQGTGTEVLLAHRPADATIMPAMYELPTLPLETVATHEPVLRVRHSITNTNYYVQVYAPPRSPVDSSAQRTKNANAFRRAVVQPARDLLWVPAARLPAIPMTGLARKILQRLNVMASARMSVLE